MHSHVQRGNEGKKCNNSPVCNAPKYGKPLKTACKTGCAVQLAVCRLLPSE